MAIILVKTFTGAPCQVIDETERAALSRKVLLAELPTWYALDTALPVMMAMVTILKVFRNIKWQQLLPLLREDELEKGAEG